LGEIFLIDKWFIIKGQLDEIVLIDKWFIIKGE